MRALLAATLAVAALACGTSVGSPATQDAESPVEVEAPVPEAVPCTEIDWRRALTTFEGTPCAWVLEDGDDARVELSQAIETSSPRAGVMPAPCERVRCVFRGRETAVGPLIEVEVAAADSEIPSGVWLGMVEGDALSFVDLWDDAGDPIFDDGISIGPPHTLAPYDCEGTLALFAQSRVPGIETGTAPAMLQAREGPVSAASGSELPRARCSPISLALP